MDTSYATVEPERSVVDSMAGVTVLEFGTPWCGWCRSAQPMISKVLGEHPDLRHIKVEDGPGQPLGRSFRIKLWPTLVFLKDGREVARVTRPNGTEPLRQALAQAEA